MTVANPGIRAFSLGFDEGFEIGYDSTAISAVANTITIDIPLGDFFKCPVIPQNDFFNKQSDCYDGEKELYDVIEMCAWNLFGVDCSYYVVDYNTSFDPFFGEDGDRTITRTFPITASLDLPMEDDMGTRFGIEGLDSVEMFVSMMHFDYVSTLSGDTSGVYPAYIPKEGDILKTDYNGKYYEIMNVKDTTEQFLQASHTWKFITRRYRDLNFNLSATVSGDDIAQYVQMDDMFNITSAIDSAKTSILITSADDINNNNLPPNDPFGNW